MQLKYLTSHDSWHSLVQDANGINIVQGYIASEEKDKFTRIRIRGDKGYIAIEKGRNNSKQQRAFSV